MIKVVLRCALMTGLLIILWTTPAAAHAELTGSDPTDGSKMASAPRDITLTFGEDIATPAFVAVQAPDGDTVQVSSTRVDGHTVTAAIADANKRGRYTASFRVVSVDGHPVSGTLHYTVEQGHDVTQAAPQEAESWWARSGTILIGGLLVAIALAITRIRRRDDKDNT